MALRTEINNAVIENGKWNVSFNTWTGTVGSERLMSITTAPVRCETEAEAYAAGNRALTILEQTGMWPDFTKPF